MVLFGQNISQIAYLYLCEFRISLIPSNINNSLITVLLHPLACPPYKMLVSLQVIMFVCLSVCPLLLHVCQSLCCILKSQKCHIFRMDDVTKKFRGVGVWYWCYYLNT